MFNNVLFISLAPILIIALYIYSRDKYEKEPLSFLLKALLAGVIIVLPSGTCQWHRMPRSSGAHQAMTSCPAEGFPWHESVSLVGFNRKLCKLFGFE